MAHAAERHLRGTPQEPNQLAWSEELAARPETGTPEQAHPCLTGLGWTLAQTLRRYVAWAFELATAGALATATLAIVGQALGSVSTGAEAEAAAVLWLGIGAGATMVVRGRDPLRQARSWGEAAAGFRSLGRRHPLVYTIAVAVLVFGTFDEASIAAPQVVQQLLQLLPLLVAVNLAGGAVAGLLLPGVNVSLDMARRWAGPRTWDTAAPGTAKGLRAVLVDPRRRPTVVRALIEGLAAPLSFVLCAPAVSGLSPHGLSSASLLVAAAVVVGLGGLVVTLGHRNPRLPQPRTWWLAVAAGIVAGTAAGAGLGLILTGGLIGAAVGTGMEVGLRLARSGAVLWRNRRQLPLASGEILYRLDDREMEITLESADPSESGEALRRLDDAYVTDDGWRVTQLSASCWEGTKGRAQLLGRRCSDLLGVIRVLHPEAPDDPHPDMPGPRDPGRPRPQLGRTLQPHPRLR